MIDSCYKNIRKLCSGVFSWKQMLQFDRTPSTDLWLCPFIFFFSFFNEVPSCLPGAGCSMSD